MKTDFKVGDVIICKNNLPLEGNDKCPDELVIDRDYEIKQIIQDSEGNDHIDVGLWSDFNFIRSYETKEELPHGDTIHWCHPSRFVKKL